MKYSHRNDDVREHQEISALLPWYVNGSIGEQERQQVDAHLALCAGCRQELAQEQVIYRGMTAESAVEHMPAASLKRLQARLDGLEAASPSADAQSDAPADAQADARADAEAAALSGAAAAAKPARRWRQRPGLMAASVAVMAIALSLWAADRWAGYRARTAPPNYYTVTTPTPHPPGAVIRAVFSPTVTLVELQAMLDEAQLRIVSGPTEAGVYSLAANSRRPVSSSLALLRAHSKVRFAESVEPGQGPGDIP
jgi:putative zinc finger protein